MDKATESDNKGAEGDAERNPISVRRMACVMVIASTPLLNGMMVGWTAVLPKLQEDGSFPVSDEDVTWLVSLMLVVGIGVSPAAGALAEALGPRRVMFLAMAPVVGFWLLQAFTPYLALLYVGRTAASVSASMVCTMVQPLVAELCPTRIRGMASTMPEVMSCAGVLLGYVLAYLLPWDVATAISAAPFLPLSLAILFVPESPYWLVRKKRIDAAERSLRVLLGHTADVTKELDAIRSTTTLKQAKVKNQMRELRERRNAIPVLLMLSVFVLRELGGKGPVFNYTVYMFRNAGVQLDAFYCTVFVGVARLASTCVSACTLDLVGRKPLLVATAVICAVSEGVAGAFLFLEVEGAAWVPLVSVIVFVIGYGIGLGPVPWIYLGELLPTPVRSLSAALITFSYSITYFGVSYLFLRVIASLGLGPTMMAFAAANLIIALLVLCFIPETKGRTLQDMETAFASNVNSQDHSQADTMTAGGEASPAKGESLMDDYRRDDTKGVPSV